MKTFILIMLLPVFVKFKSGTECGLSGYIEIQYKGDLDKPHPKIVFQTSEFNDSAMVDTIMHDFYGGNFVITDSDFLGVMSCIVPEKINKNESRLQDGFLFTIISDKKKNYIYYYQKSQIKMVYDRILKQISDHKIRDKVKQLFEKSISRVKA